MERANKTYGESERTAACRPSHAQRGCGKTGAGKTNAVIGLLCSGSEEANHRAWQKHLDDISVQNAQDPN
eukprot:2573521-Pleurochrysis_carterae.AAC.1